MAADPRSHRAWALAIAAIAIATLLLVAYLVRSLVNLPGRALEAGRGVVAELGDLAAEFRQGTVETTFARYATTLSGSNKLQVAELSDTEVFVRRESDSVLWGTLRLPDVVVEARVPVEYVYFLDLDKPWHFELEENVLRVRAPELEFNTPALDVSRLVYEVRESSILRNEDAAIAALQSGLTEFARQRARGQTELVRETARRHTSEFVRSWVAGAFGASEMLRVEVEFEGEPMPGEGARISKPTGG